MKRILGLDLGTNSIGWALINLDFNQKHGEIIGLGSRIIPMDQGVLGNFDAGQSHSQTADRTKFRGVRRLYQRNTLRRERIHRVLNIMGFLPEHYKNDIDFEQHPGQFKPGKETKLNYKRNEKDRYEFLFMESYKEMLSEFRLNGVNENIPFDWTIYFLRKKALYEKISKNELAWIILNFNQKRGYYQLRGEEEVENHNDGKKKTFEILQVKEIIETGDIITSTGAKLYKVIFENDWEYDKSIVKVTEWQGKVKEFIVTTSSLKNGEIKRTYKEVDSEDDWTAIKAKTEKDIEQSGKHIGQYIYEALLKNRNQKIRGKLIKTIERKYYKAELEAILEKQTEFHPELRDKELYKRCINELYPENIGHQKNVQDKDEFFKYLFIEDIIFYQRPLKSKKSTIGNCQYETRYYIDKDTKEKKEAPLKGIPKSHPLFQEFRLWQFLSNLKIYEKEGFEQGKTVLNKDITTKLLPDENAWVALFDFLNELKEVEQHQVLKYFSDKKLIPRQTKEHPELRWNYPEDKKYPMNETKALFLGRLKNVKGIRPNDFLTPDIETHLWHIIYSVKDKNEYMKALGKFADRYGINKESFVEAFIKIPPFSNEYGAYSNKALRKLLPLMRMGKYWDEHKIKSTTLERIHKVLSGEYDPTIRDRVRENFFHFKSIDSFRGLPTWLASYIVYDRHSEVKTISRWKKPSDLDEYLMQFKQHSLKNPIVEQIVMETLRVVRDIWVHFGNGAEGYFDEIHLELGRSMKNPKQIRERISKKNAENETTNQRIKSILEELIHDGIENVKSYSPSHQEILKIYEEGVYSNSPEEYSKIKLEEIDKIRKTVSPSKREIQRYKLWLEQGYVSPYTGEPIALSDLFSKNYQIEHIIPQSRYFDDSLNNKVICESIINPNPYKDNQTGYEFIKNMGGSLVPELSTKQKTVKLFTLDEYEQHCKRYFRKNRKKLTYLLSEEVPEGFIERQLNDSRYISKFVKSLLGNLIRQEDEQEAAPKNLITVSGAITSTLKNDWGLNDKWNELVAPRFQRLNELTETTDYGYWDKKINSFRCQVPESIERGFNKKRIDHRHHALDALVIACCTKDHINYITSLNTERNNYSLVSKLRESEEIYVNGKKRKVAQAFKKPWKDFPIEAKGALDKTVVSFKQNLRVINKTNNKTWKWVEEHGVKKKKLVSQTKGDNWAIRKPLHKDTVSGKIDMDVPKGKVATATRSALTTITNQKHIDKIVDKQIREVILPNHLKNYKDEKGLPDFEAAFSPNGIEELNKNMTALNNGKPHSPIFKVPMYEIGSKFPVSENEKSPKNNKYVEAAKGTNLFFAVYWNDKKKKREYETIPLNVVIEHQKQVAHLPKNERTQVPPNPEKGKLLFTLSPNDLVYVPTDEEIENPGIVDTNKLTPLQIMRVYKTMSSSGRQCFFVRNDIAISIQNKLEFSVLNKMEKDIYGIMIKDRCWKLKVDRLGRIILIQR